MRRTSSRAYPKGVWFQPKKLADGSRVRYGYFGRGNEAIALGREGTVEFYGALAEIGKREPPGSTIRNLIWRYKTSPEYARLRPRTRADYAFQLDKIDGAFGALSLRAMAAREIAQHIYRWRDSMSASPRRADYAIQVLKVLLSWGCRRGLVEQNRALNVERLYRVDRRDSVWSESQVTAFLKIAPEPLQRAMTLAIETGQRQADLLALTWASVQADVIKLRQQKTGVTVAIPVSASLQACLDAVADRRTDFVLTTADGHGWDQKGNGFRAAWREVARRSGVTGVTFHDLRGTFVTRRLAEGWTTQEVAMCTGHSLRDLASLEKYAQREDIARATASRIARRLSGTS